MAERTPEQEVELFTAIYAGVDHLIELLKPRPYDDVRVMAADLIAAFTILEQEKEEAPSTAVLDSQSGMLEHLLKLTERKMNRAWTDLDTMLFGLEVAETSVRIHNQAAKTGTPRHRVALAILGLIFLKPEQYVESLRVRNAVD